MFSNFQSSLVGSLKGASSKISEISGKASQSLQKDLAGFQGVGVSLPPGIAGGSSQESPARGPRGPRESSETPGTRKGTPAKGSGRQKSASSVAGGSGGGVEYVRLSTEAARRLQIMEKGDVRTLARLHAAETQKPLRAQRLAAFDGSGLTSDRLCIPKAFSLERFELTCAIVFAIYGIRRRRATTPLTKGSNDLAAHT